MTKFEKRFLGSYLLSGILLCVVSICFDFKKGTINGFLGIIGTFLISLSIISIIEILNKPLEYNTDNEIEDEKNK